MPGLPINPKGAPPTLARYSRGMRAGDTIYVSGTCGVNAAGEVVGAGDVGAQTEQTLQNIRAVLEAAGAGLGDVVMNHIFLADFADYAAMNAVYAVHFAENPPARYCVQTPLVKPEYLVEIASVAYVGG
ncbi:MAG: RidA family protein [bacterium]